MPLNQENKVKLDKLGTVFGGSPANTVQPAQNFFGSTHFNVLGNLASHSFRMQRIKNRNGIGWLNIIAFAHYLKAMFNSLLVAMSFGKLPHQRAGGTIYTHDNSQSLYKVKPENLNWQNLKDIPYSFNRKILDNQNRIQNYTLWGINHAY